MKTKQAPKNRTKIERDHMPVEVATELLATAGTHLTNTVRKSCLDARATYWRSTLEPKTLEEKLPKKLSRATGAQLTKWSRRVINRRAKIQSAYQHCVDGLCAEGAKPTPDRRMVSWLTRQKQALDGVAATLDAVRDAIESEVAARKPLCAHWAAAGHRNPFVQHPVRTAILQAIALV